MLNKNTIKWVWATALASLLLGPGVAIAATEVTRSLGRELVAVEDVFQTDDGHYVVILKTDRMPARYLRIWIAQREALAIRLRMERQKPPRPLTLNLTSRFCGRATRAWRASSSMIFRAGFFWGRFD